MELTDDDRRMLLGGATPWDRDLYRFLLLKGWARMGKYNETFRMHDLVLTDAGHAALSACLRGGALNQ